MHSTQAKNNVNKADTNKSKKKKKNPDNNNHNKFLLCCRVPVVMDGAIPEPGPEKGGERRYGDPVFNKYVKMEQQRGKDGVIFPEALRLPSSQEEEKEDEEELAIHPDIKKKIRWTLSRVLKAVFFETSLVKKIKRRKRKQKLKVLNENLTAKAGKDSNPLEGSSMQPELDKNVDHKSIANNRSSSTSSRFSSSRSLADTTKLSRSNSFGSKQMQDNVQESGKGCHSSNTGLYLLLVSLLVLVCWGKVCAIICTSIWLFFVPRWNSAKTSLQNGPYRQKIDSDEYKKKIIMEGLLERSRNR